MAENLVFNIKGNSKDLENSIRRTQAQMKSLQRSVESIGKMSASAQKLTNGLRGVGSAAQRAHKPVAALSRVNMRTLNNSITGLQARLKRTAIVGNRVVTAMAGVGTTIVLFRTAAHSVVRFEKAMGEVAAITNVNAEGFRMLQQEAQRLGATTMFSGQQAAQGLKFLAMAGLDAREATAALESTLLLAQAGSLSLGEAADIASNLMTAFRKEATDLGDIVDDLATVASSSNTSVTQLGDAMKYVSATAAAFGMPMQMASAAIGVLSDAGMQASMAGTGLRQVLVRLSGQSSAMRQGMAALGITFAEIDPQVHSLIEIIDRFAMTNINATQITAMFGARAANAFANLLAGRDKLVALTEAQRTNQGVAARMAEVNEKTLYGSLKKVQSAYENFFQTLYNSEGAAQSIQNTLGLIANTINSLSGTLQVFEDDSIEAFGSKFSDAYLKVEEFKQELIRLAKVIRNVVVGFLALKYGGAILVGLFKGLIAITAFLSNATLGFSGALLAASNSLKVQNKQVIMGQGQLITYGRNLTTAEILTKIFNKTNLLAVGVLAKLRAAYVFTTTAISKSIIALRGFNLAALRTVSVGGIITAVTTGFSTALKMLSGALTAAKVGLLSLRAAIIKFTGIAIVLYVIFEALAYIFEKVFGTDYGIDEQTVEIQRLSDEVQALEQIVNSADLQMNIQRNVHGDLEEMTPEAAAQRIGGVEVVPLAEVRNTEQLTVLLRHLDIQLAKAAKTSEKLGKKYKEAIDANENERAKEIQEEIDATNEMIKTLEEKRRTASKMGPELIEQRNAMEKLNDLTKALNNSMKELQTEAGNFGQTLAGQYQIQKQAIDQTRVAIGLLMSEEVGRAREVREATIELFNAEKRLRDARKEAGDKAAVSPEVQLAANEVAEKSHALEQAKAGGALAASGIGQNALQQQQLTSAQENVLLDEMAVLDKALRDFDLTGNLDTKHLFKDLDDSMNKLEEAGIEQASFDMNADTEDIIAQIEQMKELAFQTELLNAQKQRAAAIEGKMKADRQGDSTTIYDEQIEAIDSLMDKQREQVASFKEARNFMQQTRMRGGSRSFTSIDGLSSSADSVKDLDLDVGKNMPEIQRKAKNYFEQLKRDYESTRASKEGELRVTLKLAEQEQLKFKPESDEGFEIGQQINNLKKELEAISGFGAETMGSAEYTRKLLDNFITAFAGTAELANIEAGNTDLDVGADIEKMLQPARIKFEQDLIAAANTIAASQEIKDKKREQVDLNIAVAMEKADALQAQVLTNEIEQTAEQQKQLNLQQQKIELLAIEAEMRANIAQQRALEEDIAVGGVAPEEAEKKRKELEDEADQLKGDAAEIKAAVTEANKELDASVKSMEEKLVAELKELRKEITNQDELAKRRKELVDEKKKEVLGGAEEAGAKARAKLEEENDLKELRKKNEQDSEEMKKAQALAEKLRKEKEKKDQAREKEAFDIAKEQAGKETKGEAGISSLAAIGGGGLVGPGSNIEEKQLQVAEQANKILEQMLNVLEVPDEFGGDKDKALAQMKGKLNNEEKRVALAGFEDLINAAQDPNINQDQRDALKAQAQDLLNNLGGKAAGRNFNPEGGGLPEGALPKEENNIKGERQLMLKGANPIMHQQGPTPVELIATTNTILTRIENRLKGVTVIGSVETTGGGSEA